MSEPAVVVERASKRFGPKVAVDEVSFQVRAGDCYGLIGPNGAGKTTTFSMLCGFLRPSHGTVRLLGVNPAPPGALKGKVGVLPQDALLPPRIRVGELLGYLATLSGLDNPEREAREALAAVGLEEAWPLFAGALSHGMAKRVAMAQALMGRPPVVLLDEPTAGLDPKIAAGVRALIARMRGQQTVIVSSHNLQELEELCDAAAILDRGKLVREGRMGELTRRAEEFRIHIAHGEVPLEAVRAIRAVTAATHDPRTSQLTVHYDGQARAPDEVITETLSVLLPHGVRVLGVARGQSLEQRVLELT